MSITDVFDYKAIAAQSAYQYTYTLDSNAKKICACYWAPSTEAITHIGIPIKGRVGASPTFKVSLQGMSSYYPDGVIKNSGAAYTTFTPTCVVEDFLWVPLSYTPTKNEAIAVVLEYDSGTIGGSNYCLFGVSVRGIYIQYSNTASNGYYNGSAWGRYWGAPNICVKTADGIYIQGVPVSSNTTTTLNSTSSRIGCLWTPKQNSVCVGMTGMFSDTSANVDFVLRAMDNTILRTINVDATVIKSNLGDHHIMGWEPYTLLKDTSYRFCVEYTSVNRNIFAATIYSLADGAVVFSDLFGTIYNSGTSSWTDYTSEPTGDYGNLGYFVAPILSGVDYGGGGGGGSGEIALRNRCMTSI